MRTSRPRLLRLSVLLGALLLAPAVAVLWPSPVMAQEKAAKQRAMKLWEQATKKYNLGDWDEAVRLYKEAYDAYPAPEFLFNIGQAYRQKNDCKNGLFFYKRYLANKPDAPNRAQVEGFVTELEDRCRDGGGSRAGDRTGDRAGDPAGDPTGGGTSVTSGSDTAGGATDAADDGGGAADGAATADTSRDLRGSDGAAGDESGGAATGGTATTTGFSADTGTGAGTTVVKRAEPTGAPLLSLHAGGGMGVVVLGDLDTTSQLSLWLGAGYPLPLGPVTLELGAAATITTLQWENAAADSGTALLWSVLANSRAVYRTGLGGLSVVGELGLGLLTFSGISDEAAAVLLEPGMVADGSPSMFNVRAAVGAEYDLFAGIAGTLGAVYAWSPAIDGFRGEPSSIHRIDFLLGAVYRL